MYLACVVVGVGDIPLTGPFILFALLRKAEVKTSLQIVWNMSTIMSEHSFQMAEKCQSKNKLLGGLVATYSERNIHSF